MKLFFLNFCGLNENTWKAIDQKAFQDLIGNDSRDSYVFNENYVVETYIHEDDENAIEMSQY